MPSISVSVDLVVPEKTLIYDIGAEHFFCEVCKEKEAFTIIDRRVTRGGGPSIEQAFKNFVKKHGDCLLKKREKRVRQEARQPCRQDYRDANGHGPHECGKTSGHYGGCGPS